MKNDPKKVILHCAATPDDSVHDFGVQDVTKWHKERGFKTVGYHEIVKRDGIIEQGRDISEIGAHCEGHNQDSIGVCYIGTRRPTKEQLNSLCNLYTIYYKDYKIDYNNWFGHYEFNDGKDCPGFSMEVFRKMLQCLHNLLIKPQGT